MLGFNELILYHRRFILQMLSPPDSKNRKQELFNHLLVVNFLKTGHKAQSVLIAHTCVTLQIPSSPGS